MKQELIDLVKLAEGFQKKTKIHDVLMAVPYVCPAGFWTIGYGHLCDRSHEPIDLPQGENYLLFDMSKAQNSVISLVQHPLNDWQIAALTDFVFNLGSGRFRGSTMRAKINRGELEDIPKELRRWVFGGGRKLPGLVARREADIMMWNKG